MRVRRHRWGLLRRDDDRAVRRVHGARNAELYPRITREQGRARRDVRIDYEKAFDVLVFCAAKKYVAKYAHFKGKPWTPESKPEIKGMEFKRGDAGLLMRSLQGELIDLLCGGLKRARVPVPSLRVQDYEEAVDRHRRHVLEDPLPLEEVRASKGMSREINQYVRKTKLDGTKTALPIQARVAQELADRGEEVHAGIKVGWVVVDADAGKIVPEADYDGAFDRLHLWNKGVWPASERLLVAAFPGHDWARFRVGRPGKGRKASVTQLGLLDRPTPEEKPGVLSDAEEAPASPAPVEVVPPRPQAPARRPLPAQATVWPATPSRDALAAFQAGLRARGSRARTSSRPSGSSRAPGARWRRWRSRIEPGAWRTSGRSPGRCLGRAAGSRGDEEDAMSTEGEKANARVEVAMRQAAEKGCGTFGPVVF